MSSVLSVVKEHKVPAINKGILL